MNSSPKLNDGEIICEKCGGGGHEIDSRTGHIFWKPCHKCQGEGKLDWISAITGVAPKKDLNIGSHVHSAPSWNGSSGYHNTTAACINGHSHAHSIQNLLNEDIIKQIEEIVSNKVEEELNKIAMRPLNKIEEQTNKKGRAFFDNRIISKLLFFCNFKQRVKNKENKNTL